MKRREEKGSGTFLAWHSPQPRQWLEGGLSAGRAAKAKEQKKEKEKKEREVLHVPRPDALCSLSSSSLQRQRRTVFLRDFSCGSAPTSGKVSAPASLCRQTSARGSVRRARRAPGSSSAEAPLPGAQWPARSSAHARSASGRGAGGRMAGAGVSAEELRSQLRVRGGRPAGHCPTRCHGCSAALRVCAGP